MSRALWLIVLVVAALGIAHPASADLTGFIGSTRSPSSRVARGGAIGLSLAAGREVLASGQGSERQRAKLTEFYKVFDAGLERGLSRDVSAAEAKAETGL